MSGRDSAWSSALTRWAKTPDPSKSSPDEVLYWDDQTITIHDGFEKAKFHFLVLPRIPFKRDPAAKARTSEASSSSGGDKAEPPKLSASGGKLAFGKTSSDATTVPATHLHSLVDLLRSPYAGEVLEALGRAGEETARITRSKMPLTSLIPVADTTGKTGVPHSSTSATTVSPSDASSVEVTGRTWGVQMGFHAVPSMDTIHLHVISTDLVAPRLKHKKHYQSFHPDKGFFLHLDDVRALVARGATRLPKTPAAYESMLKDPLVSHLDGQTYPNMPALKRHLEEAWLKDMRDSRREQQQVQQQSSIKLPQKRSSSPRASLPTASKHRVAPTSSHGSSSSYTESE